jgi:sulfonate transport system permease protein
MWARTRQAVRLPGPLAAAARALLGLWLIVALVALWWVLSSNSTSPYFPPLRAIVDRLVELWIAGDAKAELAPSLAHFAVGYALAGTLGIVMGAVLWRLRWLREATSPLLYFCYVLPSAATLPALITIFGIGDTMKVMVITLAAIWPTLLNTIDGMKGVDQLKLDTARVLHLSQAQTMRWVVLPGALPQIVAGLRSSLQISIILMVVSELVASTTGIGFFILNAQQSFAVIDMWTGIIVLAFVGTALNVIFVLIERRVLAWYYGARATQEAG